MILLVQKNTPQLMRASQNHVMLLSIFTFLSSSGYFNNLLFYCQNKI